MVSGHDGILFNPQKDDSLFFHNSEGAMHRQTHAVWSYTDGEVGVEGVVLEVESKEQQLGRELGGRGGGQGFAYKITVKQEALGSLHSVVITSNNKELFVPNKLQERTLSQTWQM